VPPAVVLVTGVSRWLGGALAAELAKDPSIGRVIGVDTVPPSQAMLRRLGRTEFVRADIRNPLIAKVIASASVDTVVHMNISSTPAGSGGRTPMKELNVIGTMQLLAACQRAPSVERFVLKSTSAVYGASSRDPAVFTEAMQARRVPSGGFARDSVDIEGYVRSFARRRPDVDVRTATSRCCGSPTSSARASTRCSPASSACRSCRPRSVSMPACNCCTRTTPSPC